MSSVAGTGHADPARSVTVGAANARARSGTRAAVPPAPLGRNGKPAGSALPVRAGKGAKPRPGGVTFHPGGANGGGAASTPRSARRATWAVPHLLTAHSHSVPPASGGPSNFGGLSQGTANCGNCQTPDVTAAVSGTEIAETVNLTMQVFSKSNGASLCTMSLAGLTGAVSGLSRPRIQYDNASNRFSIVVDSVPSSAYDVPVQYVAASQTPDACGAWWVYSVIFNGSTPNLYPLGVLLDYPYLGQDNTSLLSSTNNFSFSGSYLGSAAYALPKAAVYSGAGFNFTTYQVAFSTAPVTVAGIPTFATTSTYWLAAVPGTGYNVYVMPTNPAGAITLRGTVSAPFSAPSRRVNQPGTTQTLNPLDGRIQSAGVQDGGFVWFTHDVNFQGFPTVRYGAINVTNGQIATALAYHTPSSDDFNPSIGVTDAGGNTNFIWVNWAYTDTANGFPVSDTVAGVAPGQGVPNLIQSDLTLVIGTSTASISTFGGYSSTEIDPVSNPAGCPAGKTALTAQEYFASGGTWTTRLAETTFC